MRKFTPVISLTLKGKIQVTGMKVLLQLVSLFIGRKWKYPLHNFEEDPRHFSFTDIVYFSYKYYHTQIRDAEKNSGIDNALKSQTFSKMPETSQLTISIGGDLMPYENITKEKCDTLWNEVGDYFFSSDIVFANLETPIDISKPPSLVPEVMLRDMLFNGSEDLFTIFNGNGKYRGFDVLSVANNHALDQKADGLDQTLQFLHQKNILYCGGAKAKESLHDFPILTRNGIAVAFIAFTFSLNKFDLPQEEDWRVNHIRLNTPHPDIGLIIEQAALARMRGADIVVASLHMGNAYQAYPSGHIRQTIHRICREAGTDVIAAGHPHNPQPVEWLEYTAGDVRRKSLIFYSLGDLVAYDIYSWAHLSLLVKLSIEKTDAQTTITGFEILPAYLLAEPGKTPVEKITFKHIDAVYANRHLYSKRLQRDLASAHNLFTQLLFTAEQRQQVIRQAH